MGYVDGVTLMVTTKKSESQTEKKVKKKSKKDGNKMGKIATHNRGKLELSKCFLLESWLIIPLLPFGILLGEWRW